jgi:hypothetical protein
METNFVRVGDYFINLDRVLWARITHQETHPYRRSLTLVSSPGEPPTQLTLEGENAEMLITYFETHGHDLNPPAFKPLP